MKRILVSGLVNLETTLKVQGFPIEYWPVNYPFFGINSSVSGVGFNVAKALKILGDKVDLLSLSGADLAGQYAKERLAALGISLDYFLNPLRGTPQSVILYEEGGKRQINVDLKDIQETPYPTALFEEALSGCDLAALCNINFSRPFLSKARQAGKLIATDVHTISNLEDPYNQDFMHAADILFMSDEHLPYAPEDWVRAVLNRYGPELIVLGLGAYGALLSVKSDNFLERIPAVFTRRVVNTIGAGDALFSGFIHFFIGNRDPYEAIRKAMVFASYKIGESGAADGFLDEDSLNQLFDKISMKNT